MSEPITINQGRPESPYFPIIQPVPGLQFDVGRDVRCVNTKTKEVTNGVVTEFHWTIDWREPPRGWLFQGWGVEPKLLRKALELSEPLFGTDEWARVILIKETKK